MKITLGLSGSDAEVDLLAVLLAEEDLAGDTLLNDLDEGLSGALRTAIKDDEFTGKRDATLSVMTYGKLPARKVLLIGLGPAAKVTSVELRAAAAKAAKVANADKATKLHLGLRGKGEAAELRAAAEGVSLGCYRFTKYLTGDRRPKKELESVALGLRGLKSVKATAEQKHAIAAGEAVGSAINLARDLVNEPPNELTPAALADVAHDVAKAHGLKVSIWDRAKIRAEGMKLLDAVGRGSSNEPRFIHMTYKPEKARKGRPRVCLVGKGLTFDSGGLCIKPAPGMGDMKSDMAGAALAVGAMAAIGALKPDVEVHGLVAAAENMPDGDAYRPGDVFGSLDGKTVEIINTDAEGRLVLADALAYARKLEPDLIVDHATLTGACLVALGTLHRGVLLQRRGHLEALPRRRQDRRRGDVAHAAHRGAPRRAEERRRRPQAHRRPLRRLDHRRPLPAGVHRRPEVDPPRHRGPRLPRPGERARPQGRHWLRHPRLPPVPRLALTSVPPPLPLAMAADLAPWPLSIPAPVG